MPILSEHLPEQIQIQIQIILLSQFFKCTTFRKREILAEDDFDSPLPHTHPPIMY